MSVAGDGDESARTRAAKANEVANVAVDRLIRQHRRSVWWNIALTLLAGLLVWGLWQNHLVAGKADSAARAVQQGAVAGCEANNQVLQANKTVWDEFLNIIINNPDTPATRTRLLDEVAQLNLPAADVRGLDDIINTVYTDDPAALKTVAAFEAYIAAHEAPVDCGKAFKTGA